MKGFDPKANYDAMAGSYAEKNATSVWNAMYDRPNVMSLIPKTGISHVVEVGCGSGELTKLLLDREYEVTAFDFSPKLLEIAQKNVGSRADLFIADASKSLHMIPSKSADLIISSLVFHYIENWEPLFQDFYRILKQTGSIVFSTHHPHADWLWFKKKNYFLKEVYEEVWAIKGKNYPIQYIHRTLSEMFEVFKKTGFIVDELKEPFPLSEAKNLNPKAFIKLTTKPQFLFFRLKKRKIEDEDGSPH